MSHLIKSSLQTTAILTTVDGRRINLGQLDHKLFEKVPWTPRLWFYKYITYRFRLIKQRKGQHHG